MSTIITMLIGTSKNFRSLFPFAQLSEMGDNGILSILCQILIWVAIALLAISVIWHLFVSSFTKGIDGPSGWPIIGHVVSFNTKVFIPNLIKWHHKYGTIVKLYIASDVLVSITDPELIKVVCTSPKTLTKGIYYRYLHKWLKFGLLTSSSEKWFKRRKLITPAYHFSILEQFIPVFDKGSSILVEKLRENVGKLSFDVQEYIFLCTLDIINETAMGVSVNAQTNSDTEYPSAIKELSRIITERVVMIRKHFEFLYFFTEDYRLEKKYLKVVHNYTLSVIESRRNEILQNPKKFDPNTLDDFGRRKRIAFLDLLLQSTVDGQPLSNADVQEEVDTFMFEGHDTTATAICFWLYLISKHPDIQERLVDEQRDIYDEEPYRPSTLSDLHAMNYMEMTIKEALRLYPSVPFLTRQSDEDIHYRDVTIKKGTQLGIVPYAIHRRPEVFPDPEKFDPERFSSENINKRHPFSYLAFSAGGRNCIGQKFAILELKCILGKILRHFEIARAVPEHEVSLRAEIILLSTNGYKIQLKKRIW